MPSDFFFCTVSQGHEYWIPDVGKVVPEHYFYMIPNLSTVLVQKYITTIFLS